jgi:hypothetical protein
MEIDMIDTFISLWHRLSSVVGRVVCRSASSTETNQTVGQTTSVSATEDGITEEWISAANPGASALGWLKPEMFTELPEMPRVTWEEIIRPSTPAAEETAEHTLDSILSMHDRLRKEYRGC